MDSHGHILCKTGFQSQSNSHVCRPTVVQYSIIPFAIFIGINKGFTFIVNAVVRHDSASGICECFCRFTECICCLSGTDPEGYVPVACIFSVHLSLEQVLIFGTVAVVYNFEIDFSDLVNLNSIGTCISIVDNREVISIIFGLGNPYMCVTDFKRDRVIFFDAELYNLLW